MPRPDEPARAGDRIAKLLARAGVASRREVERMIVEGRIALNGAAVTTPATVLASLAGVTLDGLPVAAPEAARLFLFHKPVGLLVTERDPAGRPTIYDRLPSDLPRLVPVGRLDLNTEGLLLLTTDGGLKRQLELPATGVERTYRARAYGQVSQAQLEALIEGVEVEGVRYGSIDANLERRTGANVWIELTLTEGKNREVRRVLEHLGLRVGRLIRTRYGPFLLGDLPAGAIGEVRQVDLEAFRRTLKSGQVKQTSGAPPATPLLTGHPRPKRLPGEGRGPAAARSRPGPSAGAERKERPSFNGSTAEPSRALTSRPHLHPGLRRGGAGIESARSNGPRQLAPSPHTPTGEGRNRPAARSGAKPSRNAPGSAASSPGPGRNGQSDADPPRPEKPKRKPGWAKPKPRTGPARPRKPRG
jgi:23S rRNA pseudouridine2605 synthase